MAESFPLLRLPGELRNVIYHFILTKEHGVIYHRDRHRFFGRGVSADGTTTSSQFEEDAYVLQQVCRQLRYESRTYYLHFNDLYFENFKDAAHFLSTTSKSDLRCVGTFHILDGGFGNSNAPAEGLHEVKEFCADYPHVSVRAHQPKAHLDGHLIWAHILLIQFMHRGSVDIVHRLIKDTQYREDLVQVNFGHAYGMTTERPVSVSALPDNLRVCLQEELFAEGALQTAVQDSVQLTHIVEYGLKGDTDHWVCRQLKAETHGLELRYNELHFDTFADLAHFVDKYPKQYFKYLKTIHVAKGDAVTGHASQAELQIVKEFCAAHPRMTIRAHHSRLSHTSGNIDIYAIAYQSLFRGSLDIAHKLIDDDAYMRRLFGELNTTDLLQGWVIGLTTETIVGANPFPMNLRICVEEEFFEEWKLQRAYRARPILRIRIDRGCQRGLDQWIKVIKQVFEEGI
ncbi:hypothetical protein FB567DRAFT_596967 [Paraphoma chrysanthemicola]|uniref:Uncharacterized protein n=1 Tax=Paraphoma chrysanthemicola TaxID=798071 RepID=A0A8K0VUD5_9PLEO|nr:hypothetical protein FB567DRAFT_596967 [Paraphoma chrysanthemicola]